MKMTFGALIAALATALGQGQERPRTAPAEAPAQLRIAARDEPGEELHIAGVVLDDAGAPIRAASIYVYQTDARGFYTPQDANANRIARIHGYLRADRNGRFEVVTIRPGSYPNTRIPQHVHFVVNATGFQERVFEVVFDDDPNVNAQVRSQAARAHGAYLICKPAREGRKQSCNERVLLARS
jgi:protocatechuate 3,4-dioxygenase beta subunit